MYIKSINLSGSKVLTVLLKGVKIEHFHDSLTADDNAPIIDPGSASRWSVTILCDRSLEIG